MSLPAIGGLRVRLTLKQTLSFAVLLAFLSWTAYALVARHIYSVVDDELQDRFIAVRTMLQIRHTGVTSLEGQADPEVRAHIESSLHYYQLLDLQGKILESSSELTTLKLPVNATTRQTLESARPTFETFVTPSGTRLRIYNSLVQGQQRTRYLMRVGVSLAEVDETCKGIGLFILAIFPLLVLLQAANSWIAARIELRPLEQINAAAKQISLEDPSRRLPLSGRGDELEQLSTTLNSMIAGFHSSFQHTSEFLKGLSHELRQPLTVLRVETEQALRMGNLGDEYHKMLTRQLEYVELLSRTVSGLLAAHTEYSEIRLRRQEEDLYELVKSAVDGMGTSAGERNIVISGNLEQNVVGEFDAGQIWRLLLNLLDNALKFTPANGHIDVSLSAGEHFALITVADSGCGISPEDLPHIFERNFRASSAVTSGVPGSGLGLHFARSIVEAHGGRIEAVSRKGEGTCFRVTLPLLPHHVTDLTRQKPQIQAVN